MLYRMELLSNNCVKYIQADFLSNHPAAFAIIPGFIKRLDFFLFV